mmetsp:Transcript_31166/g.67056  ORF Transcript_31166/g.67056 Transcript_31166/m.67056 type:complete len:381 (-) Transcript_31166:1533-2675(-)
MLSSPLHLSAIPRDVPGLVLGSLLDHLFTVSVGAAIRELAKVGGAVGVEGLTLLHVLGVEASGSVLGLAQSPGRQRVSSQGQVGHGCSSLLDPEAVAREILVVLQLSQSPFAHLLGSNSFQEEILQAVTLTSSLSTLADTAQLGVFLGVLGVQGTDNQVGGIPVREESTIELDQLMWTNLRWQRDEVVVCLVLGALGLEGLHCLLVREILDDQSVLQHEQTTALEEVVLEGSDVPLADGGPRAAVARGQVLIPNHSSVAVPLSSVPLSIVLALAIVLAVDIRGPQSTIALVDVVRKAAFIDFSSGPMLDALLGVPHHGSAQGRVVLVLTSVLANELGGNTHFAVLDNPSPHVELRGWHEDLEGFLTSHGLPIGIQSKPES